MWCKSWTQYRISATYTQIRNLAKSYKTTKNRRYRQATRHGLDYILREQRPSGGWRGSDVDAITFNDGAMTGVMQLLREVSEGQAHFSWTDKQTRRKAKQALERAIRVTLDCQIRDNGQKTAWCQQHDHKSLKPVKARTYALHFRSRKRGYRSFPDGNQNAKRRSHRGN